MKFEELSLNNSSHKIHNQYWQQTPREDSLWELLIVLKKWRLLRIACTIHWRKC